jgi:FkbM family methyltransferase
VIVVDRTEPDFGSKIFLHKTWEPHLTLVLKDHLRQGDVFVDIGANVGVMAFSAATCVGSTGRVIAFEPNHSNCQMFLRGVTANGFESFVSLYPFALSDRSSVFALVGSSNAHLTEAGRSNRLVQSLPGDEVLSSQSKIDFIKIDIEGHEPFALAGLACVLAKHLPMVLCEFNPRCLRDHIGKPPEIFADELFSLAKTIYAIEYSGRRNTVKDSDQLMGLWHQRNREAVAAQIVPDGMLHFDLLFKIGD